MVYSGTAEHLGCTARWQLACRPDGAFREEVAGPQLSSTAGYSGAPGSKCWEARWWPIIRFRKIA